MKFSESSDTEAFCVFEQKLEIVENAEIRNLRNASQMKFS